MKIAVFLSHPIQHFSPLWRALSELPGNTLEVFYYSRAGLDSYVDPEFGHAVEWDVDLMGGYHSEFLPPCKPELVKFRGMTLSVNKGIRKALMENWDVVYLAGYAYANNWIIARYCRRNGIPLLMHSDASALTSGRHGRYKSLLKSFIVRSFFKNVTVFLAIGDHNRDYLLQFGASSRAIHFVPIPVDTARFRSGASLSAEERETLRRRYGIEKGQFVVGFCGKLIDRKRPVDLARAILALNLPNVVGLFIGSGPLENTLRGESHKSLRFAGFVNQSEIPGVISLCDVLAMPSSFDNHPIIVTEAQALGIPVILSDRCGCYGPHDVFRDQETGYLYSCGNISALSDRIRSMYIDPERRGRLGKRASELADEHSPSVVAKAFLSAAELATRIKAGERGSF